MTASSSPRNRKRASQRKGDTSLISRASTAHVWHAPHAPDTLHQKPPASLHTSFQRHPAMTSFQIQKPPLIYYVIHYKRLIGGGRSLYVKLKDVLRQDFSKLIQGCCASKRTPSDVTPHSTTKIGATCHTHGATAGIQRAPDSLLWKVYNVNHLCARMVDTPSCVMRSEGLANDKLNNAYPCAYAG